MNIRKRIDNLIKNIKERIIAKHPRACFIAGISLCALIMIVSLVNIILGIQRDRKDRMINAEVATRYTTVHTIPKETAAPTATPFEKPVNEETSEKEGNREEQQEGDPEETGDRPEENRDGETEEVPKEQRGGSEQQENNGYREEDRPENEEPETIPWYEMIDVDLEGLKAVNPDVIAWIFFEDGEYISYPVLYSGDDKYLYVNYKGEKSDAGSIYLEGANSPDLKDAHSLIYGHNMKKAYMFGALLRYDQIKDLVEDHRYFQIITEDRICRYGIFGFQHVSPDPGGLFSVYRDPDEDFENFAREVLKYDENILPDLFPSNPEQIVSLSTCYYTSAERYVVSAVKIDEYLFSIK